MHCKVINTRCRGPLVEDTQLEILFSIALRDTEQYCPSRCMHTSDWEYETIKDFIFKEAIESHSVTCKQADGML